MGFVEGTSVAPRILRKPEYEAARERLAGPAGRGARPGPLGRSGLARGGAPGGAGRSGASARSPSGSASSTRSVSRCQRSSWGCAGCGRTRPSRFRARLVHGDFRLGNFIVGESGLAAVIDWELAHLGDPAEDIGWLCIRSWRFGNDELPVAGVGELDAFIAAYEAAGGGPVDRDRVRYWEAFGNVKWAVICARQANDHLTGRRRSHELASLGPPRLRARVGPARADPGRAMMPGPPGRPRAARGGRRVPVRRASPRGPGRAAFPGAGRGQRLRGRRPRAARRRGPGIADDELFAELLEGEGGAPELARRIREGDFDDRVDELADRLAEHVRRKLEVARPGYDAEG